jgi:hypothetical protein
LQSRIGTITPADNKSKLTEHIPSGFFVDNNAEQLNQVDIPEKKLRVKELVVFC